MFDPYADETLLSFTSPSRPPPARGISKVAFKSYWYS